ncbi:hypothetical protein V6N11_064764 [Hibiscus sabdariffa]|uniref:Uncharacterized protein n=1 Tax=Hibiscus sabdariffa TaxID=183260 RepID=A0ABR2SHV6_9ROSI
MPPHIEQAFRIINNSNLCVRTLKGFSCFRHVFVFGGTLWNLWLHRNVIVFDMLEENRSLVLELSSSMWAVAVRALHVHEQNYVAGPVVVREPVRWSPPEVDLIKINLDGARREIDGLECEFSLNYFGDRWLGGIEDFTV